MIFLVEPKFQLTLGVPVVTLCGLTKPRPTSHTGKARSSRSKSDGGALPVRAGINRSLMESSRGCNCEPMLGIVLHR